MLLQPLIRSLCPFRLLHIVPFVHRRPLSAHYILSSLLPIFSLHSSVLPQQSNFYQNLLSSCLTFSSLATPFDSCHSTGSPISSFSILTVIFPPTDTSFVVFFNNLCLFSLHSFPAPHQCSIFLHLTSHLFLSLFLAFNSYLCFSLWNSNI